ncbi:MAG: TraB/GumN family protein [Pseudohongiellaceae bacterium]
MNRLTLTLLVCLVLSGVAPVQAQEQPVEITVRGRQPGPPMWRVSKDEHELWIFAMLSPVPKDMLWDETKVAELIARADASISRPDADVALSKLTLLNPINIVRGMRLAKRLSRGDLQDSLPPELYQRFSKIKAERFPRDDDIEELRPLVAGDRMMDAVLEQEKLVAPRDINRRIQRLLKRNRELESISVEIELDMKGSYRTLANRVEAFVDSIPPDLELACFEFQLRRVERDIEAMKYRADSWARGYIDEFLGVPLPGDNSDPCLRIASASSEQELLLDLQAELELRWLAAAERALAQYPTTFAVLGITELLREDGLLAALAARGYDIRVP